MHDSIIRQLADSLCAHARMEDQHLNISSALMSEGNWECLDDTHRRGVCFIHMGNHSMWVDKLASKQGKPLRFELCCWLDDASEYHRWRLRVRG